MIDSGSKQIRLIHWNEQECRDRVNKLKELGFQADGNLFDQAAMSSLREHPADAVVIDLSRMPSQGRDLAVQLRKQKSTRFIPIIFVGGADDKVTRIRELLPDAAFTNWDLIGTVLSKQTSVPVRSPMVPKTVFAAYEKVPLSSKLGIRDNSSIVLCNAPESFANILISATTSLNITADSDSTADLVLWFVRSSDELKAGITRFAALASRCPLWIIWPKKSSTIPSDLTQTLVRSIAMHNNLVDYKIVAVDQTWSGLKFSRKKQR